MPPENPARTNSTTAHSFVLTTTASEAQAEPQWQLSVKTRRARFEALAQFITAHHAYETPEIVQIPISAGSAACLRWLADETHA